MRVIAELGSNWKTFEDCKNAIPLAKNCGADAIKFQLFTHEELYGYSYDEWKKKSVGYNELEAPYKMPGELPREWIPKLKEKADACGIEFMCTAFSADGVRFLDPYVKRHKLASSEMCHPEMLEALKATGKPLLVSTGAQTWKDVLNVRDKLKGADVTWLYCEASYPAKYTDMNNLHVLISQLGRAGFSDHSTDVFCAPCQALYMGASVLEKHFNPFDYTDTPDAPHSLSAADFMLMCKAFNGDTPDFGPSPGELPMLLRHKRRLIATIPIKAGDPLQYGKNFGAYRSKIDAVSALHPMLSCEVDGRLAKIDIAQGQGIGPECVG